MTHKTSKIVAISTVAVLLFAGAAEQRTYQTVGKDIRKADLVTLAYHQAVKDFRDGIEVFHAEISYGDLTGDGNEDAAVQVLCRLGPAASASWTDVFIYSLRKGRAELVARVGSGEKAHGGICLAYICCDDCFLQCGGSTRDARRLLVQRYRPNDKDCNSCYGFVEETHYELRGSRFVAVDAKSTPIDKLDPTDPCAIRSH
jgi:hypothetical protein